MKYLKYLLIVILIFSFAMVSCKKDSATGPTGGTIVGTWNVVDAVIGWLITTNANQTATNMFDVSGQINISGAHTVILNDMWIDEADPPSFFIFDINDTYSLILDGDTGQGVLLATNNQTFIGDVTFAYNNGTLTITQSTITDVASAATVTISGSLSFGQVNVPANTPTLFPLTIDDGDPGDEIGLSTVEFKNDGTALVTDIDDDGTTTENWTYTTDGNQITITDEFDDIMVYEYSISGGTLTLTSSDLGDFCEDYNTQAECFAEMEWFFNLTPGSLTTVGMQIEIILNQAVVKQGLNISRIYNLTNPTKNISDYKVKINKLRESR